MTVFLGQLVSTPATPDPAIGRSTRLFERVCVVEVDDFLRIEGLRVVFSAERSHTRTPNKGQIEIYNLSRDSRAKMQKAKAVRLTAGYVGEAGIILQGSVSRVSSTRDGTDWCTKISIGDAEDKTQKNRARKTYAKGTSTVQIVKELAESLGVSASNAVKTLTDSKKRNAILTNVRAVIASGFADDELDSLLRSMGFEWSIQSDELVVTAVGAARSDLPAVLLSPETGLVGSPDAGEGGIVEAQALLVPRLIPALLVELRSAEIQRFYRIDRVTYRGDTHGDEWNASLELRPII